MFIDLKTQPASKRNVTHAADVLPDLLVASLLGKPLVKQLSDPSSAGIAITIKVPSESWCSVIEKALNRRFSHVLTQTVRRPQRGSSKNDDSHELIASLGRGYSTIAISPSPETLIADAYHAVVDHAFDIERLEVNLVRRVIRRVSGQYAKGLTQSDLLGLDPQQVMAAIRSRSSAADCVARIKRTRNRKAAPADLTGIPDLQKLPLTPNVRAWADDLTADMARLDAGKITPSAVRFATLEGPPGTGKSLLAAALAKSTGWRFSKTSVQDWFNAGGGDLGAVTKACAAFIDDLLSNDRCIGFIDELQSIPDRAKLDSRGRDWWMPVVDGVLLQLDRVRHSNKKILLLGACNHYEMLDAALIRAGRLETRVSVQPPATPEQAAAVLAFYLNDRFNPSEIKAISQFAVGYPPAEIEAAVRQAEAIARRAKRKLKIDDLFSILAPNTERDPNRTAGVALHEAAHAVIAHQLGTPVRSVSIVARGQFDGMTITQTRPQSPRRIDVENQILISLAGRAADELLGNGSDAGAAADLAIATGLLCDAREKWGLYDRLTSTAFSPGPLVVDGKGTDPWLEEQLSRLMQNARDLVAEHETPIRALAEKLVERRTLHAPAILNVIANAARPDRKLRILTKLKRSAPSDRNRGPASMQ